MINHVQNLTMMIGDQRQAMTMNQFGWADSFWNSTEVITVSYGFNHSLSFLLDRDGGLEINIMSFFFSETLNF